jgi:hypothetical protein
VNLVIAELQQKIKKGGPEGERAKDKLVTANLRFVVSVAKQYQHQGLTLTDLIDEGNIGLIKAAQKFDETRVKVPADHDFEFLCEEGKHVDPETILCTLRPPMSGMSSHYNQDALDALDALNTLTPKAKYEGVIERIEVMYTGQLDDMSPSLQEIVTKYDSKLYRLNKKLGIPVLAAKIDPNYSIENVDVGENQVVVTFYNTEK